MQKVNSKVTITFPSKCHLMCSCLKTKYFLSFRCTEQTGTAWLWAATFSYKHCCPLHADHWIKNKSSLFMSKQKRTNPKRLFALVPDPQVCVMKSNSLQKAGTHFALLGWRGMRWNNTEALWDPASLHICPCACWVRMRWEVAAGACGELLEEHQRAEKAHHGTLRKISHWLAKRLTTAAKLPALSVFKSTSGNVQVSNSLEECD